jgi:uncharacterized protein (TIGR00251 family)
MVSRLRQASDNRRVEPADELAVKAHEGGVRVDVQVAVRAGRSAVLGVHGGRLKIALAAAPVDGAANDELVQFLARALGRARRDVSVVSGARSRRKTVAIAGATAAEIRALLP